MTERLIHFEAADRSYPVRDFSFGDYVRLNEWMKSSKLMRDPLERLAQLLCKTLEISRFDAESLVLCYGQAGQLPGLVKIVMQVTLEIGQKLSEHDRNS